MDAKFLYVILALLAAGVMYGLFRGSPFAEFEMSRLYFAAAVLAFLAFIFILAMIFYAYGPAPAAGNAHPGKEIFEACVKVIPPIVTLIIGFYFGSYRGEHPRTDNVGGQPAEQRR